MLSLQATGFLLAALCDQLGLCLPPDARRRVLDQAAPDAASFVAAVFAAGERRAEATDGAAYRDALALAERVYADHRRADT